MYSLKVNSGRGLLLESGANENYESHGLYYFQHSSSDLAYAISVVSQFMHDPSYVGVYQ